MGKEQILKDKAWEYISSLSLIQRHVALFGDSQSQIENKYNVKIKKWNFIESSKVKENYIAISVTDSFRNITFIAVLIPNQL